MTKAIPSKSVLLQSIDLQVVDKKYIEPIDSKNHDEEEDEDEDLEDTKEEINNIDNKDQQAQQQPDLVLAIASAVRNGNTNIEGFSSSHNEFDHIPKIMDVDMYRCIKSFDRVKCILYTLVVVNLFVTIIDITNYGQGSTISRKSQLDAANAFGILGCFDAFVAIVLLSKNILVEKYIWNRSFYSNRTAHGILGALSIYCWVVHGMLMMILSVDFQGLTTNKNTSGIITMGLGLLMGLFSFSVFSHSNYSSFLRVHMVFYILILFFGSFHTLYVSVLLVLAAALWLSDYLYTARKQLRTQSVNLVDITLCKPGSNMVVKVEFQPSGNFHFRVGQFIYLCIPHINRVEWHPFYISSTIQESLGEKGTISCYARVVGDWTQNLKAFSLLRKRLKESPVKDSEFQFQNQRENKYYNKLWVLGPHGGVNLHLDSIHDYDHVLFVSGGFGLTSLQAMFNEYINKRLSSPIDKLKPGYVEFFWTLREQAEVCERYQKKNSGNLDQIKYLHFEPNILDLDAVRKYNQVTATTTDDTVSSTKTKQKTEIRFRITRIQYLKSKKYKTSVANNLSKKLPTIDPLIENIECQESGKAMRHVFRRIYTHAVLNKATRIAVVVCGSESLREGVKAAKKEFKSLHIKIDVHEQLFI